MKFEYAAGATPLDPDEIAGLIPSHITTQNQLNEWESENILKAETWLFSKTNVGDILSINFVKTLHKRMFGETWKWAGAFRKTERNIGVAPYLITTKLQELLEDVKQQISHKSFPLDEIAYRFHHRLVAIHPFPNGNGRHARLLTDLLLIQVGRPRFTWGKNQLEVEGATRTQYIAALRNADKHDYANLAVFVRL